MAWETKCGKATAYAMLSTITAWLKTYYPVEFMCAVLNSFLDKSDALKLYISVTSKMGINILPPDVNKSAQHFSVDGEFIRFGLQGLKGISKASYKIIEERRKGSFKGVQDFAERVHASKSIVEAMIYSGAMDSFEGTRNAKLALSSQVSEYLKDMKAESRKVDPNQMSLFDFDGFEEEEYKLKFDTPDMIELDKKFKLEKEKEYAGFYLSEHPLDDYEKFFKDEGIYEIGFLTASNESLDDEAEGEKVEYSYDGETVTIAGIVKDIKTFYTKKDNKKLYVFQVEDRTGELKAVMFHDRIEQNEDKLIEGRVVLVRGEIKEDDFGTQIIVRTMVDIEQLATNSRPKGVWVKTNDKYKARMFFNYVKAHPGNTPAYVYFEGKAYRTECDFDLNFVSFAELQDLFGHNFKVTYHNE